MTTIRKLHADWAEKIMPKDATQTQRQEMERAFYSGAFALFTLSIAEVAELPIVEAEKAYGDIQKELEDYFRLVRTIPGTHGAERQ
jgi:hypothetical protein